MVRLKLRGLTGARDAFLLTGHRPEPEKARQTYHRTTATALDGLVHAAKAPSNQTDNAKPPQLLAKVARKRPLLSLADTGTLVSIRLFNTLG